MRWERGVDAAAGMVEGKVPTDLKDLISTFGLHAYALTKQRRNTGDRHLSRKKIEKSLNGRATLSTRDQEQLFELALSAAQREVLAVDPVPGKPHQYAEHKLHRLILKEARKSAPDQVWVAHGSDFFTFPVGVVRSAYPSASGWNLTLYQDGYHFDITAEIDATGRPHIAPKTIAERRARLVRRLKKNAPDIALAVPVVRIVENDNGLMKYVFNRQAEELPDAVVEDIRDQVEMSGKTVQPFDQSWLSDMTGVGMLLVSHPSVRNIGDEWSEIWKKPRVTFSMVMGQPDRPGERDQFNGVVQAGVIALQAFLRYPNGFKPFAERVREVIR